MSNTRVHPTVSSPSSVKTTRRKLYLAMLTASQFMVAGHVLAAPEGGQVVGGAGSIDQTGSKTTIHQETERMAIDWQSFDVKADERVQFVQPKSTSVALNRVLGNKGSEILGRIDANGKVILVNPNGIVFGLGSQINVGGIMASGLNIDPNDFMNGEFTLTAIEGTEGKVINSGIINAATGGSVTLLGKEVKNDGLISAHLGSVNLAAGKAAVVTFDPSGMVGVKITQAVLQNDLGLDPAVINSGEIIAQGGRILITASVSQDIFSQAVNHGGMNQASSVVMNADGSFTLGAGADVINTGSLSTSNTTGDAGQIVLLGDNVSNSGSILANSNAGSAGQIELNSTDTTQLTQTAKISAQALASGTGGDIKILGNKVGLFDSSTVNTSGLNGGGQILIGGDETGKNKNIRNADFIFLGENSTVQTDALLNGDGGKLITFASDTARIYGSLSARGGSEGGDGGFVETSGLNAFEILNAPDVGHAGNWLIDPVNVTIGSTDGITGVTDSSTATSFTSGASSNLNVATLSRALGMGTTVSVITGDGAGTGDIRLSAQLNYNKFVNTGSQSERFNNSAALSTLILRAANDIFIDQSIVRDALNSMASGNLTVTLIANDDNVGGGAISFASGKTIETQGGNFTANSVGFDSSSGTINTSSEAGGGDITITSTGAADVALGTLIFADSGGNTQTQVGNISITSDRNVTLSQTFDFDDSGSFGVNPSSLTITAKNNINTGLIEDSGGGNVDALDIILTADSDSFAGGNVILAADIYTAGGDFTASGQGITFDTYSVNTNLANDGDAANRTNGGDIFIFSSTNIVLNDLVTDSSATVGTLSGNLTIARRASENISVTQAGSLNIFGNTTFNVGAGGNITLNNSANIFTKNIKFTSAGIVDLRDADTTGVELGISTINGNFTLNSGGDITQSGKLVIAGAANLTATNRSVTLDNIGNDFNTVDSLSFRSLHLVDTNSIIVGDVSTIGATNTDGGLITIAAGGALTIGTINANGGALSSNQAGKSGGTISLTAATDISVGNISAVGSNAMGGSFAGGVGGNLTLTSTTGNISAASIITNGGDGTAIGGNAGTILLSANAGAGDINLANNINAQGGSRGGTSNNGTGGAITLTGKTQLDANVIITTAGKTGFTGTENRGDITFKGVGTTLGTIESATNKNLSLSGKTIKFDNLGAVGSYLGDLIINASADINTSNTKKDFFVKSLTVSAANNFYASNINTFNATSLGGLVNIAATGAVNISGVDTHGSGSGNLGGNLTIAGRNITLGTINTYGSADGGNGGAVNITASASANGVANTFSETISISGDIDTHGGTGSAAGINGLVELELNAGSFTNTTGSVTLGHSSFISSDMAINGSSGTDTLNGLNVDSTWIINSANSGTIQFTDAPAKTITFTSFENLVGHDAKDAFTISNNISQSINGGRGDDTFGINFANIVGTINGGEGTDRFNIVATGAVTATLDGGIGTDTIVAANRTNTFDLGKPSTTDSYERLNSDIKFIAIENVTGNELVDTFSITDDRASSGVIDAKGADDIVNVADDATINYSDAFSFFGIADAEVIHSNSGGTLTATSDAIDNIVWTLSAAGNSVTDGNSANLVKFTGFNSLVGGAGIDTFNVGTNLGGSISGGNNDDAFIFTLTSTVTGLINGGAGANYVDFSAATTRAYSVAINAADTAADLTVTGMGKIIGNDHSASSLTVASGDNQWSLFNFTFTGTVADGANDGTVVGVRFINFKNLIGGADDDTFNFSTATGSISGEIDGAGGSDNKIIGRNADTFWNINNVNGGSSSNLSSTAAAGSEYVKSFKSIQHLTGSTGFADTFRFSGAGSIGTADGGGLSSGVDPVVDTADFSLLSVVDVTLGAASINGVSGIESFTGNNTNSTLRTASSSATNRWTMTGQNDGGVSLGGGATILFTDFNNLASSGGQDIFDFSIVSGASITGSISGNGGTLDEIIAPNLTTTWNIIKGGTNNFNYGIKTDFSGITVLTGSASVDTYIFTEAIGAPVLPAIGTYTLAAKDSGIIVDVLNLAGVTADINLTLGDTAISGLAISGFEKIILNDSRNNSLTGFSGGSNWSIFGKNSGTVTAINASGSLAFEGFKNLTGANNAVDNFTFSDVGQIEGTIQGGISTVASTANTLTGLADSTWNITATNGGNIAAVVGGEYLEDFQNIQVLQAGEGGNTFTLSSGITFGGTINGGTGVDTLKATDGTNSFQINSTSSGTFNTNLAFTSMDNLEGGTGADTFKFNIATNYGGSINARGTLGDGIVDTVDVSGLANTLTVNLTATSVQGVRNTERVVGNSQILQASTSGTNEWTIENVSGAGMDGINDGTFTNGATVQFLNFASLVGSSTAIDNFTIKGTATIGSINGGTDISANSLSKTGGTANQWRLTDSVNNGTLNSAISFTNIRTLIGDSGSDTLLGHNKNNLWTITDENDGTLKDKALPATVSFSNMENLTGNVDADEFVFANSTANITGLIDGGTSVTANNFIDSLDIKELTSAVTVELVGSVNPTSNNNLYVKNIESITAKSGLANTLIGASSSDSDESYSWVINGNAGVVSLDSSKIELTTAFTNFSNLTGGTSSDAFEVQAAASGNIYGGDGNGVDSVDYSKTQGLVEISLGGDGSFGGTGIDGIEGITGNNDGVSNTSFNSSIGVNAGTNIWTLGAFTGADGVNDGQITINSRLISFENFNIINGGSGNDTFNLTARGQFIGTINGGGSGGNVTNVFNASASTLPQIISLSGVGANTTYLTSFNTITGSTTAVSELIGMTAANTWTVNSFTSAAKAGGNLNGIAFNGFSRLTGGASSTDLVNLSGINRDMSVGLGATTTADLIIKNIEQLNANTARNNTLLADKTIANTWDINGSAQGKLNALSFTGFANLTGGALVDTFKFLNSTADIAGIIEAGDGVDTVDLLTAGRAVNVNLLNPALDNMVANNINVVNAETINASSNFINTLTAGDLVNSWSINATNSGDLNKSLTIPGIIFTNFNNLIGGSLDDTFTFTSAGSVTGYVDGKGHTINGGDTVNLSALSNVDILLSSTQNGYRNIEAYVGNNTNSILRGDNTENAWLLSGTQNSGTINGTRFAGFTTLYGGSGIDRFDITGDSVSGSINGQGGDDSLTVNIASGTIGSINFNGGDDTDIITVAGGGVGYQAKHISLGAAAGQVNYSNIDNVSYNISYSSISTLNDNLVAEKLTLNDTQNADIFTFKNNGYSSVNSPAVFYSNKNNLLIGTSDANDQVIVDGVINLANDLTIRNATVIATANGSVKANSLSLTGTADVGSLAQRLNVDIANLSVSAAQGNIYLQAINNVNIAEFSTNGLFDFVSNGNLTSGVKLTSINDVNITTTGDIVLDKENSLSGKLHLLAGNNIYLRNDSITNLNGVTAQALTVNSSGAINGNDSPIKVTGLASLSSGGDINLNNAANDFNSLTIGSANNAYITDLNFITFTDVTTSRDFVTHSGGVATSVAINAVNVSLDAGQGLATLANITATTGINVIAQGIVTNGNLTASTIDLHGKTGNVTLNGKLDTTGKQTITVAGKTITQNASISGGDLVSLQASENMNQNAEIKSAGDVVVNAGSDIDMGTNAATYSTNGNISYSGANLSLMALDARNGNVELKAAGVIEDMNADAVNVTAKRFVADAVSGIGTTNAGLAGLFDTAVTELSLSNETGSIGIQNTGSVTIDRLRTNGDITLSNLSGNVVLDNSKGSPFVRTISDNPAETNALTSFGTTNANYNIGTLTIDVAAGSLTASGAAKKTNPDITAFNASLTASNYIGDTRPLVVYVKNTLYVYADIFSWKPLYGFDIAPVEDLSTYKGNIADIVGAGAEQLVQVETLDEVNPAIFTGVRNYVYDDIAILMPADQRYDDPDSEE